jgi:hypothetical protein
MTARIRFNIPTGTRGPVMNGEALSRFSEFQGQSRLIRAGLQPPIGSRVGLWRHCSCDSPVFRNVIRGLSIAVRISKPYGDVNPRTRLRWRVQTTALELGLEAGPQVAGEPGSRFRWVDQRDGLDAVSAFASCGHAPHPVCAAVGQEPPLALQKRSIDLCLGRSRRPGTGFDAPAERRRPARIMSIIFRVF